MIVNRDQSLNTEFEWAHNTLPLEEDDKIKQEKKLDR